MSPAPMELTERTRSRWVEGGGPRRLLRGTASEAKALNRVEADQAESGRRARGGPSPLRAWCWLGMGKPVSGRRVQEVTVTEVRCRGFLGSSQVFQRLRVAPYGLSLSLPFPQLGSSSLKRYCLLGKDPLLPGTACAF